MLFQDTLKADNLSVIGSKTADNSITPVMVNDRLNAIIDNLNNLAVKHATVADAKADMYVPGNLVITGGYYGVGDMGHATFYYDYLSMEADNGGSVLKPNSIAADQPGRLKMLPLNGVNVRQFGARGNSNGSSGNGADDTAAIQAAIDFCIYLYKYPVVDIDRGIFRITKTLHAGYGVTYTGGSIYTQVFVRGKGYDRARIAEGTTVFADFSNQPALNIQGARGTRVEGINFLGMNSGYITAQAFWGGASTADPLLASDWWDPALSASGNSDTAPYAAISFDAYSGPPSATAYPTVIYPSFLNGGVAVAPYNKPPSSFVSVYHNCFDGFQVAGVLQPNGNYGQTDFVSFSRNWLQNCIWGVSITHTDARITGFSDNYLNQCFTGLTTATHGAKTGNWGASIINTGFDRNIHIFNIPDAGQPKGGNMVFQNCYGENVYRIGDYGGTSSNELGMELIECQFKFNPNIGNAKLGYPANYLKVGGLATLTIQGGSYLGYKRAFVIDANPDLVYIKSSPLFQSLQTITLSTIEKLIHTVTGGQVFIYKDGFITRPTEYTAKFSRAYNTSGTQVALEGTIGHVARSNRLNPIAIHARWYRGSSTPEQEIVNQRQYRAVTKTSLANVALTGRILTFDFTGRSDRAFVAQGPAVGDFIMDQQSSSIFYVKSRTGVSVTAELQNNYRLVGGVAVPLVSISLSAGSFYYMVTRDYVTAEPLYGVFSNASAQVTAVQAADGTTVGLTEVQTGDLLFSDQPKTANLVVQSRAAIVSKDTTAKTINFENNMGITRADPQLLNRWTFLELPNESTSGT